MDWARGRFAIEMVDEPAYTFGSADNKRTYEYELRLDSEDCPWSTHGLRCFLDGQPHSSAVLDASGGATGIHEHSCALLSDRCLVAVGNRVAALRLPGLALLWQGKVDVATCFGLHVVPDERHVVVHGELAISKITVNGHCEWEFTGRDIFTGAFAIHEGSVSVRDFDGEEYAIDLGHGRGGIVGAG